VSLETRSGMVLQGSDPWKIDLCPPKRILIFPQLWRLLLLFQSGGAGHFFSINTTQRF